MIPPLDAPIESNYPILQPSKQVNHAASAEVDHHLMVLQAFAALDGAMAPQEAVVTIAHPS
jgi:hypothetical protein